MINGGSGLSASVLPPAPTWLSNPEPISVASPVEASPYLIFPMMADSEGVSYRCSRAGSEASICTADRVFTKEEESAALESGR